MNKSLAILFRCLGFNRPPPTTRLGRHLRRAERTLTLLALLYIGLLVEQRAKIWRALDEGHVMRFATVTHRDGWKYHLRAIVERAAK